MKTKKINRDMLIQIRVTKEEKEILRKMARNEGLTISTYVRYKIIKERR